MALSTPVQHSRPHRDFDGEGDIESLEIISDSLWCDPLMNANKIGIVVNKDEDVRIGDLIRLPYNSKGRKTYSAKVNATLPAIQFSQ